jgi:predicted DNA-binding transcriptional regulator AlpA
MNNKRQQDNNQCENCQYRQSRKNPRIMDTEQAAEWLGVSQSTLKCMRIYGISGTALEGMTPPPFVRIGPAKESSVRYVKDDLEKWIDNLPRQTQIRHRAVKFYCRSDENSVYNKREDS